MPRGPSIEKTSETQARLLTAARRLFKDRGTEWTMTELAAEAKCAVGLAYRYYPSRDAFVLAMYDELNAAVALKADALSGTTVGARFAELVSFKLRCLQDERGAYCSLASIALSPEGATGVMSTNTAGLRRAGELTFVKVVRDDVPEAASLARLLYAAHLLLVLVWTQDRSKEAVRTFDLVAELGRAIDVAWAARALPMAQTFITRIDAWWQTFG